MLYNKVGLRHLSCLPLPSVVVIGSVVLLQPMDGSESEQYAVIESGANAQPTSIATCLQPPTSSDTSPPPASSSPPTQSPTESGITLPFGLSLPVFIAICAGVLAVVLVVFLLAILMAVRFHPHLFHICLCTISNYALSLFFFFFFPVLLQKKMQEEV